MRGIAKVLIVVLVLGGLGATAYRPLAEYWSKRNRTLWRTAAVDRGSIVAVVSSSGVVKPKLQVVVGSFVSGPILELYCEFNQEVKKGDLLAKIDPRIYQASVARDRAALANHEAEVMRYRAERQQAVNDEERATALRNKDKSYIAQADVDKFKFARMSLDAQVHVAETGVEQARATLDSSLANLNYTEIRSPVDGIVINRKIDPGQTLAAQFQTPELFIIAPEMRMEMQVHASVDEADIGLIKRAQQQKLPVTFTVDAYPEKVFSGSILEIRLSSTTVQNVVTYPVVVSAPNPDLDLLPGMTANISFQVDSRPDAVRIPNAALRYYPQSRQVRPEDIPILEGRAAERPGTDDSLQSEQSHSAAERARVRKERIHRHVWVVDGELLRAVQVKTGLSDGQFTEMVDGPLKAGEALVTGVQAAPVTAH